MNKNQTANDPNGNMPTLFRQTYFHGTKAELQIGDLVQVGFQCNYEERLLSHVYVTATLHTAILGAQLAAGDKQERIYLVEATGAVEDDPNVTDKKFPGNPSLSYRSKEPFRVVGEVTIWQGHSAEQIQTIKNGLQKMKEQGLGGIID